MTLDNLTTGMRAKITGYKAGNAAYRNKLLALGLTKNTVVRITNQAPLGDPVSLNVRGFNLSLRKSEASILEVEAI